MLSFKLIVGVMLAVMLSTPSGVSRAKSAVGNLKRDKSVAMTGQGPSEISEPKLLSEGFHSSIEHPFVGVFRDLETYLALTKLDDNLPKLDEEFFKSNAVIAAFLGTRNTGGYGVEIRHEANLDADYPPPKRTVIHIAERSPAKGVMVPQMVTSPFQVVSVAVSSVPALYLSLDIAWRRDFRMYRVKSGSFTMTGGFAGTREQFQPHGEVLILRADKLITFYITMAGSGAKKERYLTEFATGVLEPDDQITINKMSPATFVDNPNSGLKATGTLSATRVSLRFLPLPSIIADGYQGEGSVEAELVVSKRQS
ncbi:MAG TPA: protease complex subunit PrcB family protein [Pyrinomonadaceae bacterium]|nr:protease complex subunit PrcB family protein [Pyrinomonadaceae bacterium]